MAHSDLEKANEKIAQKAADSLQKLEKAVVDGYTKVEAKSPSSASSASSPSP